MKQNLTQPEEIDQILMTMEEQVQNLSVSVGAFKVEDGSSGTAIAHHEPAAVTHAIPAGNAAYHTLLQGRSPGRGQACSSCGNQGQRGA